MILFQKIITQNPKCSIFVIQQIHSVISRNTKLKKLQMQNIVKKGKERTGRQTSRNQHEEFTQEMLSSSAILDTWVRLLDSSRSTVHSTSSGHWGGGNRMKGIPTPLCQIAFPSALSNARVWVKGQLRWPCATLGTGRTLPRHRYRNDSGLGHNGPWDTLFSLRKQGPA